MEQTKQQNVSTKVKPAPDAVCIFSQTDAQEFRAYQRNKRLCEAKRAVSKTQSSVANGEDLQSVCQRAVRLRQAAVRLPLSKLTTARYYLQGTGVALDCLVGGDGETLGKVKAYEAKLAVRRRADEITLPIALSMLDTCRFSEIRKEMLLVKRAVGKAKLKVCVAKTSSPTTLSRVARMASDVGARYFSVPYFEGCERLRVHLTGKCDLEVSEVTSVEQFKKLICAGVERIDTICGLETYTQLLREIHEMENDGVRYALNAKTTANEAQNVQNADKEEKNEVGRCEMDAQTDTPCTNVNQEKTQDENEETNYHCRIENGQLKFL